MKIHFLTIFALASTVALGDKELLTPRTWTSTDGKTLEAEMLELNDDSVTLKRESDNRDFKVALEKLSEEFCKKFNQSSITA